MVQDLRSVIHLRCTTKGGPSPKANDTWADVQVKEENDATFNESAGLLG